MLFAVLSTLLVAYFVYCLRWRLKVLSIFRRLNIPGPSPRFLWGNMYEIYKHGHLVMQKKWHEQYGPVVGFYFGLFPCLLVSDTELLKRILLKDFHNFADRSHIISGENGSIIDDSLLTLKGQRWKEVRSTLTPSFTSKKLKKVTPEVSSAADEFMKNVDRHFAEDAECDFYELFQALTLDTICKTGMGVDFEIQSNIDNSAILRQVKMMLAYQIDLILLIIVSFPSLLQLAGKLLTALAQRAKNSGRDPIVKLKQQCGDVVKLRRSDTEKSERSDLLQLMMDAQNTVAHATDLKSMIAGDDAEAVEAEASLKIAKKQSIPSECPFAGKPKGLTDSEVIDNALLLLLAGYETTSSSMAFMTKLLVRFPEVQERMREELLDATGGGKVFDFERLQRCQYTEAVLQESLRMYPPIYFLTARVAAEEIKYGSLTIPRGMNIFSSVNQLHYDEDVFPLPYEFQPERFLPENKTPAMAWYWQPFGIGPRNCIGMRFAQMEIKLTMAKLLTKYRMTSESEPEHEAYIETLVMPVLQQIKDPVKCKLHLL
ncbi:cytochrome P450 3A56 [Galendromus occidentalis]|uniref:Cytochrome P450 3A56 n=1 Tax=Galendromus occidentalis TaxID=34638 RepID=A0AAJ6QUV0_9ACAR|nr:cytochrome P450 3A56 [Galendromus occidentalis]